MDLDSFKKSYITWLNKSIHVKKLTSDTIEVEVPQLDNSNDCIALYVEKEPNNLYKITDDGWCLDYYDVLADKLHSSIKKRLDNQFYGYIKLNSENDIYTECHQKLLFYRFSDMLKAFVIAQDECENY